MRLWTIPFAAAAVICVGGCDFVDQGLSDRDGAVSVDAPGPAPDGPVVDASIGIVDALEIDAVPPDAEVPDADTRAQCDGIVENAGTVGLWCFEEGTGTTSANVATVMGADAPAVEGIDAGDWVAGGGIRPDSSNARIPDHASLDLAAPFFVEVAFTVEDLSENGTIFERGEETFQGGSMNRWLYMSYTSDGLLQCLYRVDGEGKEWAIRSANGALTAGTEVVAGCRRTATGELELYIDGTDVGDSTNGNSTTTTLVAEDQQIDLGLTRCSDVTCPGAPHRINGIIHAIAVHDE